jgi:hypothetical protein
MNNYGKKLSQGGILFLVSITLLWYFSPETRSKDSGLANSAFQEFSKLLVSISAVYLAFSPAFYVFIYSSDKVLSKIKGANAKKDFDQYFKNSMRISIFLVISSSISTFASYIDQGNEIVRIGTRAVFCVTVSTFLLASLWTYWYGNLAYAAISQLGD